MIDHQIDRHQRFDDFRVATEPFYRAAHRREVDHQRHAGEILQNDARNDEWNFLVCRRFRVPVRQRLDIFAPDFLPVAIAQHRFENNPDAHRQSRNFPDSLLFQSRERIEKPFAAFAGIEFSQRFKFVVHLTRRHSERSSRGIPRTMVRSSVRACLDFASTDDTQSFQFCQLRLDLDRNWAAVLRRRCSPHTGSRRSYR